MRYTGFKIKNFRGIEQTSIDLVSMPNANVFPIVGLNESGKTTVLEAISVFSPDIELAAVRGNDVEMDRHSFVPRHRIGNFTDTVEIAAKVSLEDADVARIKATCLEHGIKANLTYLKEFWITVREKFENSSHINTQTSWALAMKYPPVKKRPGKLVTDKDWHILHKALRLGLPKIQYFPTFLFQIPERIYLNRRDADVQTKFYAELFADIIRDTHPDYDMQKQVIDKIEGFEPTVNFAEFFPAYWSSREKLQIEHVFHAASRHLSKVVFGNWSQMFGTSVTDKEVVITSQIEDGGENRRYIYLEIKIKDGPSIYNVRDRSLGFRWFFCFLLFTMFRASRKNESGVLFLFDEPASNLHPRAQQQLLETFGKVAGDKTMIIYSTHSHYLINPRWLEATLLVQNKSLIQSDPSEEINDTPPSSADIATVPYKRFVGENPDKITYYQPILDALAYIPSKLDLVERAVFVEGKSDFYMLSFFAKNNGWNDAVFIPGSGSGHLDELLSLYLGWGASFLVLLDDNGAGRKEKLRYTDEYFLRDNVVVTFGDVHSGCAGKKLEGLISAEDVHSISAHFKTSKKLTKKHLSFFFQECAAGAINWVFSDETNANVSGLLNGLSARIAS